ncbi:DivIVA domain-containing protein [Haloechinothrix sp. LS1_15]|uniref:DivIVA-like cell division protein Wag31 n=1 Tax=Haloechinothrix sp. LS1_15 TaxID=2652248 RepID=UPI002945D0FB|nr:DivIVA domain-containing protein [Haloechinothrix sp. LS1_15]MDV6013465.1 DivIVA domain-containing protein [Haloechinothrix sp. LS1_15]
MSLTPADVHNVAFSKPPIGKRGYNEDEVDAFLDLVETELARLIEENNELRQQVEQLDAELESARNELQQGATSGAPAAQQARREPAQHEAPRQDEPSRRLASVPAPSALEQTQEHANLGGDGSEPNVQAAKVLGLAQEMADRLTVEAKAESDGMLAEARTKSEQLLSEARSKADSMVNEARTRAETMLNDARTRAETIERQSRDKAATMEREAQRKYTEHMNALNAEKDALSKKIDELRTIEREYRTRLRGFLESQLRELDDRGSAAPSSAPASGGGGAHAESASAPQSGNSSGASQGFSFGPRAEAG